MNGAELIAAERERQEVEEGWTPLHDDEAHDDGDLALAAGAYLLHGWWQTSQTCGWSAEQLEQLVLEQWWPWDENEWKVPDDHDPIRSLTKAGALIAAEIDRLQRAEAAAAPVGGQRG